MEEETVRRLGVAAGKAAVLSTQLPPPFVSTARSLYAHLSQVLREMISQAQIPSFMEGVARGIVESRVDVATVLPALERLPGEPKFETTSSFTVEEVREGKVFRTRGGAGYRALNEPAQRLIAGLIHCFRERRGTLNKS